MSDTEKMKISDDAVEAALRGALPLIYENLTLPYGASVRDYPNPDDLRAADMRAEEDNNKILREILRAALEAAAPHMLAGALSGHVNRGRIEGFVGERCECGRWFDSDGDYIAHLSDTRPTP